MRDAGYAGFEEITVEFAYELRDIEPYRAKAFSCLRLIPEDAFQRGIARIERDVLAGSIPCVSRYTLVLGNKPSSAR
jgi:hypothetical protein